MQFSDERFMRCDIISLFPKHPSYPAVLTKATQRVWKTSCLLSQITEGLDGSLAESSLGNPSPIQVSNDRLVYRGK